jgi:hypothetical protein
MFRYTYIVCLAKVKLTSGKCLVTFSGQSCPCTVSTHTQCSYKGTVPSQLHGRILFPTVLNILSCAEITMKEDINKGTYEHLLRLTLLCRHVDVAMHRQHGRTFDLSCDPVFLTFTIFTSLHGEETAVCCMFLQLNVIHIKTLLLYLQHNTEAHSQPL